MPLPVAAVGLIDPLLLARPRDQDGGVTGMFVKIPIKAAWICLN